MSGEPGEILAVSVDVVLDVVRSNQFFVFLHPEGKNNHSSALVYAQSQGRIQKNYRREGAGGKK